MASGKGKVSKNSKKGSKSNSFEYVKRVKEKKPEILVELTHEVVCEIFKGFSENAEAIETYKERKILRTINKFGKTYIVVDNT